MAITFPEDLGDHFCGRRGVSLLFHPSVGSGSTITTPFKIGDGAGVALPYRFRGMGKGGENPGDPTVRPRPKVWTRGQKWK